MKGCGVKRSMANKHFVFEHLVTFTLHLAFVPSIRFYTSLITWFLR